MNHIKNKLTIILLLTISYGWVACNQSKNQFQAELDKTVKSYLSLKDAFVASDTTQTAVKAKDLINTLGQTDTTALSGEASAKWSAHKNALLRSTQTLQATQKLEEQRVQFEDVSKAMYALVNDFGTETTLYKQYCPMAFDDKGAFWLSAQSDIKNPYFGDAMLTCGEVQETLKFEQ